jgi:hypothetical protein
MWTPSERKMAFSIPEKDSRKMGKSCYDHFYMEAATLSHLIQRIASAPITASPYPHFHAEHVFPEEFYPELLSNIPDISYFSRLENYPQRFYLTFTEEKLEQLPFAHFLFWQNFATSIWSKKFVSAILEKFQPQLKERFGENFLKVQLGIDASLIRDQSDYSIGPHTDHPDKIATLIFYLPSSHDQAHLGTSIYLPKDRAFKCKGLEHHAFQDFDKVSTAPFVPNSVFGFLKSDLSFHGVEPIRTQEKERLLFCYTIWDTVS